MTFFRHLLQPLDGKCALCTRGRLPPLQCYFYRALRMPYMLSPSQLPALRELLCRHLPRSFNLYGVLKSFLCNKWPGVEFWVDKWPEARVVLSKATAGQSKSSFVEKDIGVFCMDEAALSSVLHQSEFLDWSQDLLFSGIEKQYCSVIESLAKEKGKIIPNRGHVYLLYRAKALDLTNCKVPSELTLTSLREEHVPTVVERWHYSSAGVESYVQALVSAFPSRCLLDSTGRMVGWVLGQHYDVAGMLWIEPEYRRQGLAKVLMASLAQDYEEPPMGVVDAENLPSRQLLESMGYTAVPDFSVQWLRFANAPLS